MAGRNAVEHLRSVEGANNFSRPLFSTQQPVEQDGENLVRVNKASVFGDGTDAVSVSVRRKAGMAALANNSFLQCANMRLNRLGVYHRKKRIKILSYRNELNSIFAENLGQHAASGTVHGI